MIFLDLDGTLTDPAKGICTSIQYALRQLDLPVPPIADLTWMIGPPLLDSFAHLGAPDPDRALALYRERFSDIGLFENQVYDGIPDALTALRHAANPMSLATAKPHVYATRITAHFGLDAWLDHQFGPDLDGTRSDKADLLAHACDELGVDPGGAIMVGDRHHDIDAGRALGMGTVFVSWGYGRSGEADGADAICDRPRDLADTVARLQAHRADTSTAAS